MKKSKKSRVYEMKLKEYIESEGFKITGFAIKAGITLSTLWHVLEGSDMKLTTATAIVRATSNKVSYKDLVAAIKTKEKPSQIAVEEGSCTS